MNPIRSLLSTIVAWYNRLAHHKALARAEDYRGNKLRLILNALANEPELQRPYVMDGRYRWLNVSGDVKLDLFFPDVVLAFKVGHLYGATYDPSRSHVPHDVWRKLSSEDAHAKNACRECRIPLVFLAPGDPIDRDSLRVVMDRVLEGT